MKKILLILLALLLFGCSSTSNKDEAYAETYNGLYKTLLDNEQYSESSLYYDLTLEVSSLNDKEFRYYLILDNQQVAMYNVQVMACEYSTLTVDSQIMCPSVGVYEEKRYTLIPNQVNKENNYVKGFSLSGISESKAVTLDIIIKWSSEDLTNSYQELLTISSDNLETVILTTNVLDKINDGTIDKVEDNETDSQSDTSEGN